jgi:hypothetical protein
MKHLNNSQFADKAGVTKQSVSKGIKAKIIHKTKDGIDPEHPVNRQYIANPKKQTQNHSLRKATAGKKGTVTINGVTAVIDPPPENLPAPPGQNIGDMTMQAAQESLQKIQLENKKLREQIKKLEIDNQAKENIYVPREFMLSVHEKMNSVIVSVFHNAGKQLASKMDSIYENTDSKKTVEARHQITEYVHKGLDRYKEESIF